MTTRRLPWVLGAFPLLAALHAGCGTTAGNTSGDDGGDDSGFVCPDGDTCVDSGLIGVDDGPTGDARSGGK